MPIYSNTNPLSLESLEHFLHDLEEFVPSIAELAAPRIDYAIEQEFAEGRDPYGNAWARLRPATLAKGRTPPPLTDTGAMRESVTVRPTPHGLYITVDWPAHFHQRGTKYMAARPILPEQTLPPRWVATIEQCALELLGGKS